MVLFPWFLLPLTLFAANASPLIETTVMSGSSLVFSCDSSFAPVWAKVNTRQGIYKTIANNGKKHPSFYDSRFKFSETKSAFTMEIDKVVSSDAGTYVCDGTKSFSYLLTVVR